ncbi:hypothetical protein HYALB_00008390 [Hymenoscyphus albidus]|uniref:Uncharacterized protein n=1 Tax=Hymenoscyphus albidus TaxID=595503 RepID=A0A9N9Q6K2_9HELO|nr:hypothetical protein HYALB_00008390 [Hymenoscyphus albidus]
MANRIKWYFNQQHPNINPGFRLQLPGWEDFTHAEPSRDQLRARPILKLLELYIWYIGKVRVLATLTEHTRWATSTNTYQANKEIRTILDKDTGQQIACTR